MHLFKSSGHYDDYEHYNSDGTNGIWKNMRLCSQYIFLHDTLKSALVSLGISISWLGSHGEQRTGSAEKPLDTAERREWSTLSRMCGEPIWFKSLPDGIYPLERGAERHSGLWWDYSFKLWLVKCSALSFCTKGRPVGRLLLQGVYETSGSIRTLQFRRLNSPRTHCLGTWKHEFYIEMCVMKKDEEVGNWWKIIND